MHHNQNLKPNLPIDSAAQSQPDAASILSALAAMAKAAPQPAPATASAPVPAVLNAGGPYANSNSADPRVRNMKSPTQSIVTPAIPVPGPPPPPAPSSNPLAALAALLPQAKSASFSPVTNISQPQSVVPGIDTQKLTIIQLLLQQGIPIEQITAILAAQQPPTTAPPQPQQPLPHPFSPEPRGRRRHSPSRSRSPPPHRRSYSRSISRSPPRRGRRQDTFDSPPPQRRRGSPSYDDFRGRSRSRSRSPPLQQRRRSPPPRERSPFRKQVVPVVSEKDYKPRYIEWDDSLKPDRFRGIYILPIEANVSIESDLVCWRRYKSD